jgi:hypothetical protein
MTHTDKDSDQEDALDDDTSGPLPLVGSTVSEQTDDGHTLIYDRWNGNAWLRSTIAVDAQEYR